LYDYPPTVDELRLAIDGFDKLFDYMEDGQSVKPKTWLGDQWNEYNEIMMSHGYGWKSSGKASRWVFGYVKEDAGEAQVKLGQPNDLGVDEIRWSVKVDGKIVEARPGEKAWAFVKAYDRNKRASTDRPKKECKALYEYLQGNKEYCDGEYIYTLSRDGAFFYRKPVT